MIPLCHISLEEKMGSSKKGMLNVLIAAVLWGDRKSVV